MAVSVTPARHAVAISWPASFGASQRLFDPEASGSAGRPAPPRMDRATMTPAANGAIATMSGKVPVTPDMLSARGPMNCAPA